MFEPPDYIKKILEEQESLRKMLEPTDHIKGILEEQELLRKMWEPTDHIKGILEEQESLRKMLEPTDHITSMLKEQKIFDELFAYQGPFNRMLQTLINTKHFDFEAITDRIKRLSDEISFDGFGIHSEGSIAIDEQIITVSDISKTVIDLFEHYSEDCSIEGIFTRLKKLKEPVQRIVIWLLSIYLIIVLNILANLATPKVEYILSSLILRSKREVTQAIKNLPLETDLSEYKEYRVVTVEVLNLREKPNMKSHIVEKLRRGRIVRVVQKKKNWTKVEIENPDSNGTVIGWVATRYIACLKR